MLRPARAVSIAFALVLAVSAASAQALNGKVKAALTAARLGDARVGVVVRDIQTGDTLAAVNPDGDKDASGALRPFIPASNQKLLTAGAAIALLGADYTLTTELVLDGDRLIVRGCGDPAFGDPELLKDMGLSTEQFIDAWRDAIVAAAKADPALAQGRVREIVIDTRIFDDEGVHPSWPADQLNRWYCAEVWGFNFHANVLAVFASPTKVGQAPRVRTEPAAHWMEIDNQAKTVGAGANTAWVSRAPGGNTMRLHGNVRWPLAEPIEVAITGMPTTFGRLLADRIEAAGLSRPSVRLATPEENLSGGRPIAVVRTPLSVVLERCNTDSHNLYAECLLKLAGHKLTGQPGSWATGGAALRMVIQDRLGPRYASTVEIADGSGMSRLNRVTPGLLVAWTAAMVKDPIIGPAFLASLPVAAESGTLRKRFRTNRPEHEIRAKTGYLSGVSSLTGVISDRSGEPRVAFSVIVNGLPNALPLQRVKDFQEKVVVIADEWLAPQTADQPGG